MVSFSRARNRWLRRPWSRRVSTPADEDARSLQSPLMPLVVSGTEPQANLSWYPTRPASDNGLPQGPARDQAASQLAIQSAGTGGGSDAVGTVVGGEDDAAPVNGTHDGAHDEASADEPSNTNPESIAIFPPLPPHINFERKRPWASLTPAALKPQLYLDLSQMSFAPPTSQPSGDSSAPYVFGSTSPRPREASLTPSPLKLLYGRAFAADVATLIVGPDRTPFKVHRDLLVRSSKFFDKMLSSGFRESQNNEVLLDEDDANAFAILIEWLYSGTMKTFNPVLINKSIEIKSRGGLPGDEFCVHVPLPSYFGNPTVTHEAAPHYGQSSATHEIVNGQVRPIQAQYDHICTQSLYASLSVEELRFVEHYPNNRAEVLAYVSFLQGGSLKSGQRLERETEKTRFAVSGDGSLVKEENYREVLRYLEDVEQIPVPIPFPTFIEAEFLQLSLIKAMITAEKYCWEDAFNAAMDAFRQGEIHLARPHPAIRHIELAYSLCPRKSPLVTLLADLAFYHGKANQSQSQLVEVGCQYPEFLEDLMARHDERVVIPGFDTPKKALRLFRGPLTKAGGMYHLHDGKLGLNKDCPPECVANRRERR